VGYSVICESEIPEEQYNFDILTGFCLIKVFEKGK
jgi:hypothetical protein